jgi:hypothetical protein
MPPRLYCHNCRRTLSINSFDVEAYEGLGYRLCKDCEEVVMVVAANRDQILDGERAISLLLLEQEGGETEAVCEIGRVDLLTDEYVIEVKHVSRWMEATKVLLYARHFPGRKPRVHLFGTYSPGLKDMVERELGTLGIVVTWQREPSK